MLVNDLFVFLLCVSWFGWGIFFFLIYPFFLVKHLNPLFDEHLEHHLPFIQYFGGTSAKANRAGYYALLVVNKKIFARNNPKLLNYDFRSRLTPKALRLCQCYAINVAIWALVLTPTAIVFALTSG